MTVLKRSLLDQFLKETFNTALFDDYCPNGLQIEGTEEIKKILFSVSATRHSAYYAAKTQANALIVHHGLFWKFHGTRTLTGPFYQRVAPLIKNDINLYGYHLPLDAHPEIGNASSIAKLLDLENLEAFGNHKGAPTGIKAKFKTPMMPNELKKKLEAILGHSVLHSNPIEQENKLIRSIGIITGGANSEWRDALREGLDSYLTGEMSEHDYHESRESNIHMFAGGHHATEKFGIQSLMKKIQEKFPDVICEFLDSDNPA